MGGFNPYLSDIDFLVVVEEGIEREKKKELISVLLEIDQYSPAKGFEMSIMKKSDTLRPNSPTPFELHFSNYHKKRYQNDPEYICSGDDDPDLLAHLSVTLKRGVCIYGKAIKDVISEVPRDYYINAIMYDLNDARKGIEELYEYYVLNLCRSLLYLNEGVIASKLEGGEWAINNIANDYLDIVREALLIYKGNGVCSKISTLETNKFLDYMFGEIDQLR